MMLEKITQVIADIFEIDQSVLEPDRELMAYGIDSARLMDLVVAIEDTFNVEISDDMMVQFRTANDIAAALETL